MTTQINSETRMHSSRMRTTHSSSCLLFGGSASGNAGIPPRCGPGDHPRCGPGDHPKYGPGDPLPQRPDPSTSHLDVGLETPPCRQTDTCKNITFTHFGR